jgi:proteasome lid subunit RPN8/RPN11
MPVRRVRGIEICPRRSLRQKSIRKANLEPVASVFNAVLVLAFLLALARESDLIDDPAVRNFCVVLARAAVADRSREHGAFVVRTPEEITYFVVWPPSGEKDVLRWRGRFPDGTIAVLHTHPSFNANASEFDRKAAAASGVPVYVITPTAISKTTGGESRIVARDWQVRDTYREAGLSPTRDRRALQ